MRVSFGNKQNLVYFRIGRVSWNDCKFAMSPKDLSQVKTHVWFVWSLLPKTETKILDFLDVSYPKFNAVNLSSFCCKIFEKKMMIFVKFICSNHQNLMLNSKWENTSIYLIFLLIYKNIKFKSKRVRSKSYKMH